jgi:hypothetical protein
MLPESDRRDLAIQVLTRSATVSDLSARHGVSRKFVYQQTRKARLALDDAFLPAAAEDEVLFEVKVTKIWLRQAIVALALMCRASYLGIIEFMRDMQGIFISIGTIHTVLQSAAQQAGVINRDQDLSGIRVGLHDEIFQGATPVLAGVCAASTYCYLLVAAHHRDADSWAVHLLDATEQGLKPDYTIADAGQGLRAGQQAAWGGIPAPWRCLSHHAPVRKPRQHAVAPRQGRHLRRKKPEVRIERAGALGPDNTLATQLALARQSETQAQWLARDIRTLTEWLSQVLFDFIVEELERREPDDVRRIRPVRVALRNPRDDLLAFAGVIDEEPAAIAQVHEISQSLVREACLLHRAYPAPRPRTGRGGTVFDQCWATNSTRSATP